ncbi:hypothetical protein JTB14_004114 [Gonioctena quinquepunctata]|nr:hypothetical protein JTB14_004114 [Gonioctena quinquepunctata]
MHVSGPNKAHFSIFSKLDNNLTHEVFRVADNESGVRISKNSRQWSQYRNWMKSFSLKARYYLGGFKVTTDHVNVQILTPDSLSATRENTGEVSIFGNIESE